MLDFGISAGDAVVLVSRPPIVNLPEYRAYKPQCSLDSVVLPLLFSPDDCPRFTRLDFKTDVFDDGLEANFVLHPGPVRCSTASSPAAYSKGFAPEEYLTRLFSSSPGTLVLPWLVILKNVFTPPESNSDRRGLLFMGTQDYWVVTLLHTLELALARRTYLVTASRKHCHQCIAFSVIIPAQHSCLHILESWDGALLKSASASFPDAVSGSCCRSPPPSHCRDWR